MTYRSLSSVRHAVAGFAAILCTLCYFSSPEATRGQIFGCLQWFKAYMLLPYLVIIELMSTIQHSQEVTFICHLSALI